MNEISFLVTKKEYRILRSAMLLELSQEVFLKRAKPEGRYYRLRFAFEQLAEFIDYSKEMLWWFEKKDFKRDLKKVIKKMTRYLLLIPLVGEYTDGSQRLEARNGK